MEKEKKSWIDWRVFWTVMFMLVIGLPLLGFLAQLLIAPGSGHTVP